MPPIYRVRAQVVDIRTDTPRSDDSFLVDTNVWAWAWYFRAGTASSQATPQAGAYIRYLDRTRANGAARHHVALSLAELAHLIEREEHQWYSAGVGPLPLKDYRHNLPAERARVVGEIQRVRGQVESDSSPLSLALDPVTVGSAFTRLLSAPVDGYDLFLLEAMSTHGVTQILSDDGDFCTVAGITLFTANPRVLAAAQAQRRLVTR